LRPFRHASINPSTIEHLVVIGHPRKDSFNHSLAEAYCERVRSRGQAVVVRDLYSAGFDPLLKSDEHPEITGSAGCADVALEVAAMARAAAVVIIYPIWYGMPPAVIVGYVDRVLGAGLAISAFHRGRRENVMAGKGLVLMTTSASTLPWLASQGQWHGLRSAFDLYLETILSLASCDHEHFDSIVSPLLPTYATECLGRAGDLADKTCCRLLDAANQHCKHLKLLTGEGRPSTASWTASDH